MRCFLCSDHVATLSTLFLVVMLCAGNCKWISLVHELKCQVVVREGWRVGENCQERRLCHIISQGNPSLFEPKARTIYCQSKYQIIMVLLGSKLLNIRFIGCFYVVRNVQSSTSLLRIRKKNHSGSCGMWNFFNSAKSPFSFVQYLYLQFWIN